MTTHKSQIEPIQVQNVRAASSLAQALSGPLDSLLAMVELLQRQPLAEAARVQVQAIVDAGRRMDSLLCNTLETETAYTPAPATPTSLRELVDDVEAFWRSRMTNDIAQVLISCNAPPGLRVMVDPASVRRVLNTLIENALETRTWGVVEVNVSAHANADGLIAVSGRLEAPGARTASSDGVALDLCRAILGQMDGALTRVENSGAGVQTSFEFYTREAGCEAPPEIEISDVEGPLPLRTHLLIVDDNATNRIVAAALCEMFGCTSEVAEDGLEAVDAVQSRHFDLILMDIKMPRMDGVDATKTIRALETNAASTPIVALTANADPDSAASYLAAGMQAVVDKPIKPAQLLSTLQRVLTPPAEGLVQQASAA